MKSLESTSANNCKICRSETKTLISRIFDDRYGFPGFFDVLRCEACGFGSLTPSPAESDLEKIYTRYYPRKDIDANSISRSANYRGTTIQKITAFWKGTRLNCHFHPKRGSRVLDIGCGSGNSLIELRQMGVDAMGTEFDQNVRPLAEKLGLNIHFGNIQTLDPALTFDFITMNQVLEHIPDPIQFLSDLRSKLKPGAQAILSFPNIDSFSRKLTGKNWINWHAPYHLHFFSRNSIKAVAEKAGYRVVSIKTVTPNEWFKLQMMDLIVKKNPGVANPTWNPQSTHSLAFLLMRKTLTIIAYASSPWLRLMDAVNMGDSFLVFLTPRSDGIDKIFGSDKI